MGANTSDHKVARTAAFPVARFWLGLGPRNAWHVVVYAMLLPMALLRVIIGAIAPLLRRVFKMVILLLAVWVACFSLLAAPVYVSAAIHFTQSEFYKEYMLALLEFTNALFAGKLTVIWAEHQPSVRYIADFTAPCVLLAWSIYLLCEMFAIRDRASTDAPGQTELEAYAHRVARSSLEFADISRAAGRLWGARALAISFVLARAISLVAAVAIWWMLLFLSFRETLGWWPDAWTWVDVALFYLWETVNAGLFGILALFDWQFAPAASLAFVARLIEYLLVLGCVAGITGSLFHSLRIDLTPYRQELLKRLAEKEVAVPEQPAAPLVPVPVPAEAIQS